MRRTAKGHLVLLGAIAYGALAGCYQHVIRAEGPGEQNVDIYEPNVSAEPGPIEQLESAVWGDEQKSSSWSRAKTGSKP